MLAVASEDSVGAPADPFPEEETDSGAVCSGELDSGEVDCEVEWEGKCGVLHQSGTAEPG